MTWADDIRARVNVADVIGEYARLKPTGRTRFVCLSPFKNETRPSCNIDIEKGVWYDFSTKQGGDVVKFIMLIENLEYREALEFLGHKFNIADPGRSVKGEAVRAEGREALYKSYEAATQYCENILWNTSIGAEARAYLEKRGVTNETARKFRVGAAGASWDALSTELLKKGARDTDLITAGLSLRKREGTGVVDAFRNRLIFPVSNPAGRIIAFGGRALDDHPAKYINSANSPIYNKSIVLYGLAAARRAIGTIGYAILVEGYMDVVSLVQAGFENTIATCGTALTESHLHVLNRYTREVVIAMDGDRAGRDAAVRTATIMIGEGAAPRIMRFPEGDDPDEHVKRNGTQAMQALIEKACDPVTFVLDNLNANASGSARDKEAWIEAVAPIVKASSHLTRKEHVRQIAGRLSLDAQIIDSMVGWERALISDVKEDSPRSLAKLQDANFRLEASILSALMRQPSHIGTAKTELMSDDFSTPAARAVFEVFIKYANSNEWDGAILALDGEIEGIGEFYGLLTDEDLFPSHRDFADRIKRLISRRRNANATSVERELAKAEKAGDFVRVSELAKELSELKKRK